MRQRGGIAVAKRRRNVDVDVVGWREDWVRREVRGFGDIVECCEVLW